MPKTVYTLQNSTGTDLNIGSSINIPAFQIESNILVEDGSADDQALEQAIQKGWCSVVSASAVTYNNAVKKRPVNGRTVLASVTTPVIYGSSGSSNTTGQITLTTALSYQPSGVVKLHLPAGVIVGDATGGLYNVIFSTTAICQIVGSPTTANGAFTQSTAATVTLASVVVPGGMMGPNSMIQIRSRWSSLNNANVKTIGVQLGSGVALSGSMASNVTASLVAEVSNRGATNIQNITPTSLSTQYGLSTAAVIAQGATDTSVASTLVFTVNNATATDYVFLENYTVEIVDAA